MTRAERRSVLSPGRELPARARRAVRLADPPDHVPSRAGRERGGGVRKLTGRPGSASSPAAGRDPGRRRRPHGEAGLLADVLLVGQVPQAFRGREAWQELDYGDVFGVSRSGMGDRFRRPHSRAHGRGVLDRAVRQARAGRARARRTSSPRSPPPPMPIRSRPSRSRPRRGDLERLQDLAGAERRSSSWARAAGPPRRAAMSRRSARRTSFRWRAFRCRASSTTARRATSAFSAWRWTRRSPAGFATPTSCWRSAAASARCPRAATRSRAPHPQQTLIHAHPDAVSSAVSTSRILALAATLPDGRRLARARSVGGRLARVDARGARRLRAESRARAMEATSTSARSWPSFAAGSRRRRPDLRASNFTVWAHRFAQFTQFGTQACPRSGSMGCGLPAAVAALVHPGAWSSASPVTATSS